MANGRTEMMHLLRIGDELLEWMLENNHQANLEAILFASSCGCGSADTGIGGVRQIDGRMFYKLFCDNCRRSRSGALRVPKQLREVIGTIKERDGTPCEVRSCKERFSQTHHVFPSSIDWQLARDYPTIQLCEHHHRLWHQMTGVATGKATK
jgi:hypothetical protein